MRFPMSDEKKAVLVTTKHRGVFFGYINGGNPGNLPGSLAIDRCRNVLYWDASCKGFLGLAANGPSDRCRVGPAANVTLYDVTSVADVTPTAVAKFEAAPWQS